MAGTEATADIDMDLQRPVSKSNLEVDVSDYGWNVLDNVGVVVPQGEVNDSVSSTGSGEETNLLLRLTDSIFAGQMFERRAAARQIVDAFKQTYESNELIEDVIVLIERLVKDEEQSVRTVVMEQIPDIGLFCHEVGEPLQFVISEYILPYTITLLSDRFSQVRKVAQTGLFILTERGVISAKTVEERILPVILKFPQRPIEDDHRPEIEVTPFVCKLAPLLGKDVVVNSYLRSFCQLCDDPVFHVRRVCALGMADIAPVIGTLLSEKVLLPRFLTMCEDEIWGVRKSCAEVFTSMASVCSYNIRTKCLAQTYVRLLEDQSRWVQMTAFQTLGQFIATFMYDELKEAGSKEYVASEVENNYLIEMRKCVDNSCTMVAVNVKTPSPMVKKVQGSEIGNNNIEEVSGIVVQSNNTETIASSTDGVDLILTFMLDELDKDESNESISSEVENSSSTEMRTCAGDSETIIIDTKGYSPIVAEPEASENEGRGGNGKVPESLVMHDELEPVSHEVERNFLSERCAGDSETTTTTIDTKAPLFIEARVNEKELDNGEIPDCPVKIIIQSSETEDIHSCDDGLVNIVPIFMHDELESKEYVLPEVEKNFQTEVSTVNLETMTIDAQSPLPVETEPEVREEEVKGNETVPKSPVEIQSSDESQANASCADGLVRDVHRSYYNLFNVSSPENMDEGNRLEQFKIRKQIEAMDRSKKWDGVPLPVDFRLADEERLDFYYGMSENLPYIIKAHGPTGDRGRLLPVLQRVYTVMDQKVVPPALLKHFLSMADSTNEYSTTDDEIPSFCVYAFPAVVVTLGSTNWPILRECFEKLALMYQWKIRYTLGSCLHEIAKVIGPDLTERDLVPFYDAMTKDIDEVRIGILSNMATFASILGERARLCVLDSLNSFLRTDNKNNWRFRFELGSQLEQLTDMYEPEDVFHHLCPISLELALDSIADVRKAALVVITRQVMRLNSINWVERNEGNLLREFIMKLVEILCHNIKWVQRQSFATLSGHFIRAGALEPIQFAQDILPHLLSLSSDKVPNVRIIVAQTISSYVLSLDYFTDPSNPHNSVLMDTIARLQNDSDADVRFYSLDQNGE